MLTCFDANFDEVWQAAERKGAEIVFWPSAYGGGMPLCGYAMIHNYYVVAAGWGNMIDVFGRTIEPAEKPRAAPVHCHARPRPDDRPHQLQRKEGPATPQRTPRRGGTSAGELRDGKLVRAAGGEARRPGARFVQTVPNRDAPRIPPTQSPADQPTAQGGEDRLRRRATHRGSQGSGKTTGGHQANQPVILKHICTPLSSHFPFSQTPVIM